MIQWLTVAYRHAIPDDLRKIQHAVQLFKKKYQRHHNNQELLHNNLSKQPEKNGPPQTS